MKVNLTQQEVVTALLNAAAVKSGVPVERLGRITSWGKAWQVEDGKTLIVIDAVEVDAR